MRSVFLLDCTMSRNAGTIIEGFSGLVPDLDSIGMPSVMFLLLISPKAQKQTNRHFLPLTAAERAKMRVFLDSIVYYHFDPYSI